LALDAGALEATGVVFTDLADGWEAGLAAGLLAGLAAGLAAGGLAFLAGGDFAATAFLATLAFAGAALPLGAAAGLALPVFVVLAVNSCLLKETPGPGEMG
jgi:hypothetical protein